MNEKPDWTEIQHACGAAIGVPLAFANLISDRPDVRHEAYFQLDNYVVLQSDLYEAAFYCIPFLIDAVGRLNKKYHEVYDLIFEIANGTAPGTDVEVAGQRVPLEQACKEALRVGAPIFASDAINPEFVCRETAVDILHSLGLLEDAIYERIMTCLQADNSAELPTAFLERIRVLM